MDIGTVAFIVGTILTIIFGWPTLNNWLKSRPSEIIFVEDSRINLFNITNRDITGLEVTYNGNRISENSYLLKAFFLYQGKEDITNDKATKPLYLELPEDSIWHHYKIIKNSEDLEVTTELVKNRLYFDFDLLKNNDYFFFEIFVEIKNTAPINNFKAGHRIVNVNPVKKVNPNDTLGLPIVALFTGFLFLVYFVPFMFFLSNVLTSKSNGLDYYSNDIELIYYLDSKAIDIDSLNTVFSYRVQNINSYLKTPGAYDSLSVELKKEYIDLVSF